MNTFPDNDDMLDVTYEMIVQCERYRSSLPLSIVQSIGVNIRTYIRNSYNNASLMNEYQCNEISLLISDLESFEKENNIDPYESQACIDYWYSKQRTFKYTI